MHSSHGSGHAGQVLSSSGPTSVFLHHLHCQEHCKCPARLGAQPWSSFWDLREGEQAPSALLSPSLYTLGRLGRTSLVKYQQWLWSRRYPLIYLLLTWPAQDCIVSSGGYPDWDFIIQQMPGFQLLPTSLLMKDLVGRLAPSKPPPILTSCLGG